MSLCRCLCLSIVAAALAGCASRAPAPRGAPGAPVVVEAGAAAPAPAAAPAAPTAAREGFYVVKKGDTLRKIAQDHGRDYRQIAAWNNLADPNKLEVGQELRVAPPEGEAEARPIVTVAPVVVTPEPASSIVSGGETLKRWPRGGKIAYSETALAQAKALDGAAAPKAPDRPAQPPAAAPANAVGAAPAASTAPAAPAAASSAEAVEWTWPVAGKVIGEFAEGGGKESNKGIDLAGRMGEPVQAAAAGKVTYVGSLRGYGDFLVIRHNSDYISVYAHASKILVKKDQVVSKGQKIAEVGSSDADQPKLHFEIRQQSRPVDPLKLLPAR